MPSACKTPKRYIALRSSKVSLKKSIEKQGKVIKMRCGSTSAAKKYASAVYKKSKRTLKMVYLYRKGKVMSFKITTRVSKKTGKKVFVAKRTKIGKVAVKKSSKKSKKSKKAAAKKAARKAAKKAAKKAARKAAKVAAKKAAKKAMKAKKAAKKAKMAAKKAAKKASKKASKKTTKKSKKTTKKSKKA